MAPAGLLVTIDNAPGPKPLAPFTIIRVISHDRNLRPHC